MNKDKKDHNKRPSDAPAEGPPAAKVVRSLVDMLADPSHHTPAFHSTRKVFDVSTVQLPHISLTHVSQPRQLDIYLLRDSTATMILSGLNDTDMVYPCIAMQVTGRPCKDEAPLNGFLHHSLQGYFGSALLPHSYAAYEPLIPPHCIIHPALPTENVWTIIPTFHMEDKDVKTMGNALPEPWVHAFVTKVQEHLEAHKPPTVTDCILDDLQRYADYVLHQKQRFHDYRMLQAASHGK